MAKCEVCGNDYDKSIQVFAGGKTHTYDCFECAIHDLAPTCDHCGVKIIGHGLEARGKFYCCAYCARQTGEKNLKDRATDAATGKVVLED